MLGLRLDEPFAIDDAGLGGIVDGDALERLVRRGLVEPCERGGVRLTPRGRLLGDAVTAEILA